MLGQSKNELEKLEIIKTIAQLENEALVDKNNQLNKEFAARNTKIYGYVRVGSFCGFNNV